MSPTFVSQICQTERNQEAGSYVWIIDGMIVKHLNNGNRQLDPSETECCNFSPAESSLLVGLKDNTEKTYDTSHSFHIPFLWLLSAHLWNDKDREKVKRKQGVKCELKRAWLLDIWTMATHCCHFSPAGSQRTPDSRTVSFKDTHREKTNETKRNTVPIFLTLAPPRDIQIHPLIVNGTTSMANGVFQLWWLSEHILVSGVGDSLLP